MSWQQWRGRRKKKVFLCGFRFMYRDIPSALSSDYCGIRCVHVAFSNLCEVVMSEVSMLFFNPCFYGSRNVLPPVEGFVQG